MNAGCLHEHNQRISSCRLCPRLVEWREQVGREKRAAYRDQEYWARPVAGFGDGRARLLICGLAPAAHGGNRTGRVFTGDRSGDWLFAALYRAGYANQPTSKYPGDGLRLKDCYITACVRCAPPANRPSIEERDTCRQYLVEDIQLLERARTVLCLGSFAWEGMLRAFRTLGWSVSPKPTFGHGSMTHVGPYAMVGCYHPSQQNTFTGKLTPAMMDAAIASAHLLCKRAKDKPKTIARRPPQRAF